MKTFLLWLLVCGPLFVMAQTVRTVSNNPNNLAQYNTIQAAINASSSGDTIYVHGSPTNYDGFTIEDKRLTIIGPGFSPETQGVLRANLAGQPGGTVTINGTGSNGTIIEGIYFANQAIIRLGREGNVPSNLLFKRNFFNSQIDFTPVTGGQTYEGYIFEGNHFSSSCNMFTFGVSLFRNFIFQNNLFTTSSNHQMQSWPPCEDVIFDHNVFASTAQGTTAVNITSGLLRGVSFTNNIFSYRFFFSGFSPNFQPAFQECDFRNNLFYQTDNSTPIYTVGNNTHDGTNLFHVSPQIVDQALLDARTTLTNTSNFRIQNGSPAKGTGTGGKDMGLRYDDSGPLNWANSRNSRLPRITNLNVTTPIINTGGTINVQVQARRSN